QSAAHLARETSLGPARNGTYDLMIFDRCAPGNEQDLPRSNTFFLGRPPPPWKFAELPRVDNPYVTGWMANHPLLRDLRALYTIEVDQSFKLTGLPPRTPLLIEGRKVTREQNTDTALLVALSRQSYTDLVLTFPLFTEKGDW